MKGFEPTFEPEEESRRKLTVSIDDKVLSKVRLQAAAWGTNVNQLVLLCYKVLNYSRIAA